MLELTVRLVFSLAVVIGLLLLIAKFSARRFRSNGGATIQVVHRQALSRTSAVSVLTIGGRVLVIGSTEQQISLLAELDPEDLVLDELEAGEPTPEGGAGSPDPSEVPDVALEPVGLTILDSPRTVPVSDPGSRHMGVAREQVVEQRAQRAISRDIGGRSRLTARTSLLDQPKGARASLLDQPKGAHRASGGALAGSILSPDTWRQALAAARRAS